MKPTSLVVAITLASTFALGCKSKPTDQGTEKLSANPPQKNVTKAEPSEPSQPPNEPLATERADLPSNQILDRAEADLDGDGTAELVILKADGTLHVGAESHKIVLHHDLGSYWAGEDNPLTLQIVELDATSKAVVFRQYVSTEEDPNLAYTLFGLVDGKLKNLVDDKAGYISVPHIDTFTTGEPGAFHVVFSECIEDGKPGKMKTDIFHYRWDATSRSVRLAETKSETKTVECYLAACPFVFVGSESRGEILRNLRTSELGGTQALNLGVLHAGRHPITIKELKPETTYLDAVWVDVGGQRILPTSCGSDNRPAYCDADGRREIVKEGAQLALEFELSVGGQATVHATGYYLPTR